MAGRKGRRYRRSRRGNLGILFVLLALCMFMCFRDLPSFQEAVTREVPCDADGLEIHFIDVGQGDATLIKCGEHAMLIDAGDYTKGTAVQFYLKKQGVTKLDYVIGTHLDADHIGGLDVVITKFDCDVVMYPEYEKDTKSYFDLIDAMKDRNYQNTPPEVGKVYALGEASFTVLAPIGEFYEQENNYSIAIRLVYGDNSFLFLGDAESESEREMLQSGRNLKADVLKAAHHGSSSSLSEEFMQAVEPVYAVISCGKDNDYGHPHEAVLNILRRGGCMVFRTDEQGTVIACSDGREITWSCEPTESGKK
ncbi:MAG: ComEC/Rec2 family competence protein [Bacillota bacterium]|nr:ComEC/Rec2 family competence protein [Bacillota bacterium]